MAIGLSTTKPESQNTGMDTRKPVNANATSSLPLPNILIKVCAIVLAAPLASNTCPIITPRPIMIPTLPRVLPKPFLIDVTRLSVTPSNSVLVSGNPPITPMSSDAISIARNA